MRRNAPTFAAATSGMPTGIQPSPHFTARFAPPGQPPPTWIGGQGFCTGLGQAKLGEKSTNSPWYSACFSVHSACIASMRSRSTFQRRSNAVPWCSISSAFQPPPTPNRKRPFESWSSEATILAVWIGSRWMSRHTPVASLIVRVTLAALASATKGSITS
jgi:hypothetical protein